jgi:hypothetical protein
MQLLNICVLIVTLVLPVVNLMTDDQLYRNLLATLISEDKLEEWEAKAAELELPLDYYIQEFV